MSNPRLERFAEAYLAMAGQARYRPQAPGDGFGNILLTRKQCGDCRAASPRGGGLCAQLLRRDGAA